MISSYLYMPSLPFTCNRQKKNNRLINRVIRLDVMPTNYTQEGHNYY